MSQRDPLDPHTASAPVSGLMRFDRFLGRQPYWLLALVAWLVVAVKAGVLILEPPVSTLASFPTPEDRLTGTSYGLRTLAWIFRQESSSGYIVLALVLTIAAMIAIPWALSRRLDATETRFAALVVISGSIGVVLLGNISRNDVFVILGALLLGVLGSSMPWAIAGVILMSLGNPEQSVIATACYVLVCIATKAPSRVKIGVIALVVAVVGALAITVWARSANSSGRAGYFFEYLGNSIYHFGRDWPLSLYAAYGVLWIVVGFVVMRTSGWSRLGVIVAMAIIPLAITATTLDQTRVFVGISAASLFLVVTTYSSALVARLKQFNLPVLALTSLTCLLMPAIEIDYHGAVRPAYEWVFTTLTG